MLTQAEPVLVSSARQLEGRLHYDRRHALQRLLRLHELNGNRALAEQTKDELAAFERQVRAL
jgi:hypothetical protein